MIIKSDNKQARLTESSDKKQASRPAFKDTIDHDVLSDERNALENTMRITDYTNGRTLNVPDTYQPSLRNQTQLLYGEQQVLDADAVDAVTVNDSEFQTIGRNNFIGGTFDSEAGYPPRIRAKSATRNASRAIQTEKAIVHHRSGSVNISPSGETSKVKLNSLVARAKTITSQNNGIQSSEGVKPYRGGPMTIDQVSPELAAQIIKQFVIPMFDTDISKGLRRKHDRLSKTKGPYNKDLPGMDAYEPKMEGTVLGDLKLTEHLSN